MSYNVPLNDSSNVIFKWIWRHSKNTLRKEIGRWWMICLFPTLPRPSQPHDVSLGEPPRSLFIEIVFESLGKCIRKTELECQKGHELNKSHDKWSAVSIVIFVSDCLGVKSFSLFLLWLKIISIFDKMRQYFSKLPHAFWQNYPYCDCWPSYHYKILTRWFFANSLWHSQIFRTMVSLSFQFDW